MMIQGFVTQNNKAWKINEKRHSGYKKNHMESGKFIWSGLKSGLESDSPYSLAFKSMHIDS